MRGLIKKKNNKSEEHFHDEWALGVSAKEINAFAPFTGPTSPEYKEAVQMLGSLKGKKVLNTGCGLGEETVYMASKGAKVVAIDISKEMLRKTKELAKRYNVVDRITFKQMSAEKLLWKSNTFDLVFGCNILHHVNLVKMVKEVKRVLKKDGVAVFSEPLAYNPFINVYRVMASKVRTDHEHPLMHEDFVSIKKIFPKMSHKEFQLSTLLIFVWFFIGERQHPNKTRYWKKIITEAKKYKKPFQALYGLDKVLLKVFPFLRKYCWVSVIRVQK